MRKYLASRFLYLNEIEEITVERETDTSYWVNGNVSRKVTKYDQLFDSFDEAKMFLVDINAERVAELVYQLTRAQGTLDAIENKKTYKSRGNP